METSALANLTMSQAENYYHGGHITADQWEGFMHAWATSAPRFGSYAGWTSHEFVTPESERVALELGCCAEGRARCPGCGVLPVTHAVENVTPRYEGCADCAATHAARMESGRVVMLSR